MTWLKEPALRAGDDSKDSGECDHSDGRSAPKRDDVLLDESLGSFSGLETGHVLTESEATY